MNCSRLPMISSDSAMIWQNAAIQNFPQKVLCRAFFLCGTLRWKLPNLIPVLRMRCVQKVSSGILRQEKISVILFSVPENIRGSVLLRSYSSIPTVCRILIWISPGLYIKTVTLPLRFIKKENLTV